MIDWVASLSFSVYLIHAHPIVLPILKASFLSLSKSLHSFIYLCVAALLLMILVILFAAIDKIMIYSLKVICCAFLISGLLDSMMPIMWLLRRLGRRNRVKDALVLSFSAERR